MSLTVGKYVYFTQPPQLIPPGTGATILLPFTAPSSLGIPSNAVRLFYRIDLLRCPANGSGQMDTWVNIRVPSDQSHNLHSIGIAGIGQNPGGYLEPGGMIFDVPNDPTQPFTFYWYMSGASLNGTNWAVSLLGYELP